jgi:hypothetical protein
MCKHQVYSFALQPSDLHNIVMQLKTMLSDEIQSTIQIVFKTELENAVKGSIQGFIDEIDTLKKENGESDGEVDIFGFSMWTASLSGGDGLLRRRDLGVGVFVDIKSIFTKYVDLAIRLTIQLPPHNFIQHLWTHV